MDTEETKAAYMRALGEKIMGHEHERFWVDKKQSLLGLDAARQRLDALLEAGNELVAALNEDLDMHDPRVARAIERWNELK